MIGKKPDQNSEIYSLIIIFCLIWASYLTGRVCILKFFIKCLLLTAKIELNFFYYTMCG